VQADGRVAEIPKSASWSTPWLLTIAGEGPVGVGAVIGGIVGIYVAWITDHTFVDILVALYSLPSEGALTLELVDLVRARGAVLTRIARAFVDIYLAIFAFEAWIAVTFVIFIIGIIGASSPICAIAAIVDGR